MDIFFAFPHERQINQKKLPSKRLLSKDFHPILTVSFRPQAGFSHPNTLSISQEIGNVTKFLAVRSHR